MVKIAPSILSADPMNIGRELKLIEEGGADLVHIDVMDGHFVPNLTFGPRLFARAGEITSLPLDVHLMVSNPEEYIETTSEIGAHYMVFHLEATFHPHRLITAVKERGMKAGVSINPGTPVEWLYPLLEEADLVLVMTVNPGFSGQKYIPWCSHKVDVLNQLRKEKGYSYEIEVDGGVSPQNAGDLVKKGADILVAGSAVFRGNVIDNLTALRGAVE